MLLIDTLCKRVLGMDVNYARQHKPLCVCYYNCQQNAKKNTQWEILTRKRQKSQTKNNVMVGAYSDFLKSGTTYLFESSRQVVPLCRAGSGYLPSDKVILKATAEFAWAAAEWCNTIELLCVSLHVWSSFSLSDLLSESWT